MNFLNSIFTQIFEFFLRGIEVVIANPNLSYGITIIVVTAVLKIILLPLNLQQTRSMNKMSAMQPELQRLQERYKNDPARLNQEMQKLYKDNKINPFAGCLPLLIQFPIIIAFYNVFANLKGIDGVGFLWIKDLASPDPTFILPLLAAAFTFLSSSILQAKPEDGKKNAQAQQMKIMNIMMTVMIGFMSLKLSSALVLYWVANSVFQIVQTLAIKKFDKKSQLVVPSSLEKPAPKKKPQAVGRGEEKAIEDTNSKKNSNKNQNKKK